MTDVFSDRLAAWRSYTDSPWGRLRYLVAERILQAEADRLGPHLRVLDVGGGDGMDAVPLALAGHDVTVLDQSAAWLAEAEGRAEAAGTSVRTVVGDLDDPPALAEFDLVLCHFVLQYRPEGADDLTRLAAFVRPGGILSVMLPNPAALVLRQLVGTGPDAALAELGAESTRTVTFDHPVRKVPAEQLVEGLEAAGLPVVRRYGLRIANDLLVANEPKHEADYFEKLLQLELALCDREPFVRVGGMYQLVATKGRQDS